MEFLTLFFVIVTSLLCAALAAAFFGFRPSTFEQAVAAESRNKAQSCDSKSEHKKKKTKRRQTTTKSGPRHSGLDESDEDDSMADEDVAVGLLHARGIDLRTTETMGNKSPRPAHKTKGS